MTDLSIADEMAKRLVDEIRKEFDLQMVQSMIDTMMPDREKYETFYHDLYNGLIISDKMTDFTLYFLQRLLYDVHTQYKNRWDKSLYDELEYVRRLIPLRFDTLECINIQILLSYILKNYNIKGYKFPSK